MSTECFECGQPSAHQHHVVPKSLGGTRTLPLCLSCHRKAHQLAGGFAHPALTKAALAHKKSKGERVGTCPRGFKPGPGKALVPDENEQRMLALVRDLRASGMTLREIAAELERLGYTTRRGKPLHFVAVGEILRAAA